RFHVLDAHVIGATEPDAVNGRVGDHLFDRVESRCFTDAQCARERGSFFGVLAVGTPHAPNVGVTHTDPGPYVKASIEPAADESDAKPLGCRHESSRPLRRKKSKEADDTRLAARGRVVRLAGRQVVLYGRSSVAALW